MINCQETLDGINCDKCDDNSYFNEEGKCISVKYCSKEGNYSKCIKCNEGYFLDEYNNSCTKEQKCKYGDKDLGLCLQCINNYYIDFKDGKCKPSINDYIYCVKADQECYQCIQGTFLGEDKKCSLSDKCAESFNGICTHCINSEYHLDKKNYCTNIEKCIDYENYYNFCKECETGFYFNSSNGICLEEIKNFENCRYTNKEGTFCEKCRDDFYLNNSDHLCYSNKEKNDFYKCAFTLGEKCDGCVNNYFLGNIDNKCSLIEGCEKSENENKCLICDSEIYCLNLKNNNCINNEFIEQEENKFYYRCNITNIEGDKCEKCLDNYTLNNKGLCEYKKYCEEYDQEGFCNKCIPGNSTTFTFYCLNSQFGCINTNTKGCEICDNILDFDLCDKCENNFILENNKCIEK